MQTIAPPNIHSFSPEEIRAMLKDPGHQGNREEFLRATLGTMTEEEADEMERIINASCERIDDWL